MHMCWWVEGSTGNENYLLWSRHFGQSSFLLQLCRSRAAPVNTHIRWYSATWKSESPGFVICCNRVNFLDFHSDASLEPASPRFRPCQAFCWTWAQLDRVCTDKLSNDYLACPLKEALLTLQSPVLCFCKIIVVLGFSFWNILASLFSSA